MLTSAANRQPGRRQQEVKNEPLATRLGDSDRPIGVSNQTGSTVLLQIQTEPFGRDLTLALDQYRISVPRLTQHFHLALVTG